MNETAKRLQDLRISRGDLTQEKISEMFDIPIRTWKSYEYGTRNMPTKVLVSVAQFFNVSTDYLLGLSNEQLPQAKEFQDSTGLSEDAIANISKYKNYPNMINCINQFLSSNEFIIAIENTVYAKTPIAFRIRSTDEVAEIGKQAQKRSDIMMGKKQTNDVKLTLTGEKRKEYELWQAKQNLSNLIDRIVKGEKDNGTH